MIHLYFDEESLRASLDELAMTKYSILFNLLCVWVLFRMVAVIFVSDLKKNLKQQSSNKVCANIANINWSPNDLCFSGLHSFQF